AAKRVLTVANESAGELDLHTPLGMPDGNTVSFTVSDAPTGTAGTNRIAFVSVDGSRRVLTPIVSRGALGYLDGWLLYGGPNGGGVLAMRFDLPGRTASGDAVRLADSTVNPSGFTTSISARGDLAYVPGSRSRKIAVLGGRGEEITTLADPNTYSFPSWSPDGNRIVYAMPVPGARAQGGLWIFDAKAGTTARLSTSLNSARPAWSPDGKRIAFVGIEPTTQRVYVIPADGSAPEEVLYTAPGTTVREITFTPDGRSLVLTINSTTAPTKRDIVRVAIDGSSAVPLRATAADEKQPAVSGDGRWLAYMSDESGTPEVYVRSMNGATGSAMISRNGGSSPRWTRDGRIVYFDGPGSLRRVELTTVGGLPAVGRRDSLFTPQAIRSELHQNYDLTADGRFVFVRYMTTDADVLVVTDWWQRNRARLRER
ncbi:MAG: hypothetical protein ABIR92_06135, partial [Gemmatimonadaceae bacterium]